MKQIIYLTVFTLTLISSLSCGGDTSHHLIDSTPEHLTRSETVHSPDGLLTVTFSTGRAGGDDGCLFWRVTYDGETVIGHSRLGLIVEDNTVILIEDEEGGAHYTYMKDNPRFDRWFSITSVERRTADTTWRPVWGEQAEYRDRYNEMTVTLVDSTIVPRTLLIAIRAYDGGAALQYRIPEQRLLNEFTIKAERTHFRFTGDHICYPSYAAQWTYEPTPISNVQPECERPLTVEIGNNGLVASIAEAALLDYARMRLRRVENSPHELVSSLDGTVDGAAPFRSPWRVVLAAPRYAALYDCQSVIWNLNEPCALDDISWIKPGKIIRDVTLSTNGGKACIDFAVERGLDFVHFDAGWYGNEVDPNADALTVSLDPKKAATGGGLDLREVIDYAAASGVGVILYVNQRALTNQEGMLFQEYERWGVAGIKFGFVDVGSHEATVWLHNAVRRAAEHHLMVDIHDAYRPTGFSRTYPNLMTQEGIYGNEMMPGAHHNTLLPFTRFLCGPADYTFCWYDGRVKNTCTHQLALPIVFYSPWQVLYWYDRPEQYQGEPELEFWKHMPTVWDETRVLHDAMGEYITFARRSGNAWFIGSINAGERRTIDIPLDFLEPDKRYMATIHADGAPDGSNRRAVSTTYQTVRATDTIEADMAHNGGHAVRIVPE